MSKAFTKETDAVEDDAPEGGAPLPSGLKNYMTPQGFAAMQDELKKLIREERPKVVETVAWAAGNGDRSENGDYIYGKQRLREIDRRIRYLTKRMENAEVVDPMRQTRRDQVFFGATVTYATQDGAENTITIVGVDEATSDAKRVSWVSPIARALLKAREGDTVDLNTPAGIETIEVITIEYPGNELTMAKRRVVLLHFIAQMPMAGIAWQALQYLVGLEKLGYETWYVENHGANPYDPRANSVMMDCSYNVAFLKDSIERFGFKDRWAYWDAINDVYHGLSRERVFELLKGADALINLCGATKLREEHMACPVRIMVDTDPVYEQIKYAKADPGARAYLDAHTHFFTYGENVGGPGWIVPLCGIPWQPTRPPVEISLWPETPGAPEAFSTIATWENKGKNIEFKGEQYVWSKHVNFLRMLDVPKDAGVPFTMAMLPPTPEVEAQVTAAGWRLTDPRPVSASIDAYVDFIRGSRAEFTVAKDIYVRPKSGWFSDRSVCYLASGRPVVTMASEFSRFYPVGEGLFEYTDKAGALAAIKAVNADYARHAKAARRMAEEFFASERVVGKMMKDAGL